MFDGSDQSNKWDDQKEHATCDDSTHDLQGSDDCNRFAIRCCADQDKWYQLQKNIMHLISGCIILWLHQFSDGWNGKTGLSQY